MRIHRTPDYALVRDSDRARFESKVDRSPGQGPRGDCHEWTASRVKGYGAFGIQGGNYGAHVIAMFFATGEWPSGTWPNKRQVMHSCDNPPCCNLSHLSIGTAQDNVRDMGAKGRGDRKLTATDVRAIRSDFSGGLTKAHLARQHGVSRWTINAVVNGKTWNHIT